MSLTHSDEAKKRAKDLAGVVADKTQEAFYTASELTKVGVKAAKPKVIRAADATVKAASPLVDSAVAGSAVLADKAGDGLRKVHQDLVDDYLPRLSHAVEAAADKVTAVPVDDLGVVEVAKKPHRVRKVVKWGFITAGVAGVGYLLWRRSRPIEDPWAEDFWSDLEASPEDVSDIATEQAADAETAADTAAIAIGEEDAKGDED